MALLIEFGFIHINEKKSCVLLKETFCASDLSLCTNSWLSEVITAINGKTGQI